MKVSGLVNAALAAAAITCVFGFAPSGVRAEALQNTESASAETQAGKPQTFKCEGSFGRDASHAKLAKEYSAANIDTEEYWDADGEVTVLFPKDPERQLKIEWKDKKARRRPAKITIEGRSLWSVAGVTIGTSLVEVERLNGRPFKLNYFDGDYGGAITDWVAGRLNAPFSSGCRVGVYIGIDEHLPEALDKALEAEVTPDRSSLLSSGAGLRAAKPRVDRLVVIYPK